MRPKFFKKHTRGDFVVIDSQFPQKEPFGFRNTEVNEYIKRIKNFDAYTMYPMLPGQEAWFSHGYGVTEDVFNENKEGYLERYPANSDKIHYLNPDNRYSFKLAYSFFLAETYVLLPFLEKHKIPFAFVLYPGGAFGMDNPGSDKMLKAICSSEYFRCVIVTQQITKDYLIRKELCAQNNIHLIYGGFVQFTEQQVRPKQYYKKNKQTFDICFVAAKYSEKGEDKGYDLFIKTAKQLVKKTDDIKFHVIGGFEESDINVDDIKGRITFYGYKQPDFLADFYSRMDIFLGPGRPGQLFKGNFDGFPLGIDAGYCGVALFVSDKLQMNHYYKNDEEICIVDLSSRLIVDKILQYYQDVDSLYALSKKCQERTRELFGTDHQINERLKVFKMYTQLIGGESL